MINLLPFYQKIKINREKKWKFFSLFSFYIIIFFIFLSFYLCLIINISSRFLRIEGSDFNNEKIDLPVILEKEEKIMKINKLLSEIDYFQNKSLIITDILREIHEILPDGTYVKSFQFNKKIDEKDKKDINEIILSGYSPDWQSLLKIEEGLKNNFSNIKFSPGTWTEIENINFLVSFEIQ